MLTFNIQSSEGLGNADLVKAGITSGYVNAGQIVLPDGAPAEEITAAAALAANPSSSKRRTFSDQWAACNAKVAALPPVPGAGPDTYATIRARLEAERDACKAEADALGGLI